MATLSPSPSMVLTVDFVRVAFAQILLGLRGGRSRRIWGEGKVCSGLVGGDFG